MRLCGEPEAGHRPRSQEHLENLSRIPGAGARRRPWPPVWPRVASSGCGGATFPARQRLFSGALCARATKPGDAGSVPMPNTDCQFAATIGVDTNGHGATPGPRSRHTPRPCPLMSPHVHPCPLSRTDAPPFRNAKVRGSSPLVSTTLTPQRLGTCVVARVDDRRPLGGHCQFAARNGGSVDQ